MPEHILLTSWYTGLGGGETDLLSLAEALDISRWIPHLLIPREGQLGDNWRKMGFPVHVVSYRGATTFFIPQLWMRFPVVNRIEKIIKDNNIRLVHSEYHTLPFAYGAARRCHIPIMWTVHGWWFRPKFWQRKFFRKMDAQVARSKSIRDGFLGNPPFMNPEDLPVIYSGVDTSRFRPNLNRSIIREKIGIDDDTPLVVMVARFQEVKGHHTFQAMAKLVAEALPSVHFVVAGEDTFGVAADDTYKNRILENAKTDPVLQSRLYYIGFRDDVENVYSAGDVYVCASNFESYGKANIEAMACGIPVVTTNQGGTTETVIDRETGFFAPAGDAETLAKHVIHLLNNPDERNRLGENGRRRVEEVFSARATGDKYVEIFEGLLEGRD